MTKTGAIFSLLKSCIIVGFAFGVAPAHAETPQDNVRLLYSINIAAEKCALPISAEQQTQVETSISGFEHKLYYSAAQIAADKALIAQKMDVALKPNPKAACKEMNEFLGFALKNIPMP